MEEFINNYNSFDNSIVYDFKRHQGGIGDYIKFFMCALESCIKSNTRMYCKKNNIEIENYIKLKYEVMYVNEDMIAQLGNVTIVNPYMYHSTVTYNYSFDINQVFYFVDEVKENSKCLLPDISNYISIHLRLGDKHLETNMIFIASKKDTRIFPEDKLYEFIEKNNDETIFFCCDNNAYKLKLKEKYNKLVITNCKIGHTALRNTTKKQILDAVTEFYILTNSKMIFRASPSGFSMIASKFNNIPFEDAFIVSNDIHCRNE